MNIQIFWNEKGALTVKKAERYFKERGIKYQFIDMKEKMGSAKENLTPYARLWAVMKSLLIRTAGIRIC